MPIEWSINTYKTLPSTQDTLKDMLKENATLPEGYVVLTDKQTNGYGRHGRAWGGDVGNLYMSFLLRPSQTLANPAQIALISGLALTQTIENNIKSTEELILKWPNDVLISNQKCAGILIEGVDDGFIVGIGVNIISASLDHATHLNAHSETEIKHNVFYRQFFDMLDQFYTDWLNKGFASFRDMFINRTYPKGTHIGVNINRHRVTGKFDNIDKDGSLILLCDETGDLRKITSGDVFLM